MMVMNDGDDEMAARGLAFGLDPVDVWVVADSVGTSQIRVETSQGRVLMLKADPQSTCMTFSANNRNLHSNHM